MKHPFDQEAVEASVNRMTISSATIEGGAIDEALQAAWDSMVKRGKVEVGIGWCKFHAVEALIPKETP